jgi:hypothetical protein
MNVNCRRRAGLSVIVIVALIIAASATSVSPASAKTYRWIPDRMSPMLTARSCHYRIQYGTYASHPYAFLRLYGSCQHVSAQVHTRWTDGTRNEDLFAGGQTQDWGTDSCSDDFGYFREIGGPVPHLVAFGIGMRIQIYLPELTIDNRFNNDLRFDYAQGTAC